MADDIDRNPTGEPTEHEEEVADRNAESVPDVSEEYRDMTEKGANVEGEGEI